MGIRDSSSITDLTFTYPSGVQALRGVNFTVNRGEMVAIMGPSGCGKTTLLNSLSGLDDFDEGDVWIDGTALRGMKDAQKADLRARRTGFVFQAYNLLPVLNAAENVALPLLLAGQRGNDARARAMRNEFIIDLNSLLTSFQERIKQLAENEKENGQAARQNEP